MAERSVHGGRMGRALVGALVAGTITATTMVSLALPSPAAAIGTCTMTWTGAAGDGLWATAENWDNGVPDAASVACIPDVGDNGVDVDITLPGSIDVAGIDNSERIIQPAGATVTLTETSAVGEIVNRGVWRMAANTTLQGSSGGEVETFTNHGGATLHKTGGSNAAITARFTNSGTIDVGEGSVSIPSPAYLGTSTYHVAEGATLAISSIDGVTQWQGVHDVDGGGTVTVDGEVDSFGMEWAFGPDEATLTGVVDASNSFVVTGALTTPGLTIRGDGFAVAANGVFTQPQSSVVTLDPDADVNNHGVWRMAANTTLQGSSGGEVETFTNHGGATLHKTGPSTATIHSGVRLTNSGTVHAAGGSLTIGNLEQISDTTLTDGTYFADDATITLPSAVETIGSGAIVHLGGSGSIPQIGGLTSNTGTFRLSGGKDFTTTASLDNSGVLRTGPGSTLTVSGPFTNSGTYRTDIAGTPASGQYGFVTASGAATLGGTFVVITADAFTPVFGDAYDVVRYASRNGTFGVHEGIDPHYRRAYDPGNTNLLRLTVGQGPVASAGGPYLLDEGGSAVALDSSLSADPDGTIVSYAWSPATGLDDAASGTPSLTPPADNTAYDITLTVTDDDGLEDSDTATVTVQNVPPVISGVTLPAAANEGTPVNLQVTFTDQGAADTHVANIDWGDSTGHSDAATSPLALQHTYTAPGNYTVDVCIQDDDLGQVCTDRSITITNVNLPPQITPIGTPYHGSEGDSVFPFYDLDDPDGPEPFTYSWSVPAGTPATFSDPSDPFPGLGTTDDASFDITLEVCDDGTPAACGTAAFPVVVDNTAPVITFFNVPSDAEVGESISAAHSTFDPGDDPVSVTFDWGDGTQPGITPAHTYTAQGTYTVTACPSDGAVIGPCASDTITVDDASVNGAPIAGNDTATVSTGSGGTSIAVLNNDLDPDNDAFTITAFQNPSAHGGTVSCTAVTCTYTPAAGFTGSDTFTYTITDQPSTGTPLTDTATVTVTVADNQPPVADNDTATVRTNSEDNQIFVLGNDFDPDDDPIAIVSFQASTPEGGTVTCSSTANFGPCEYTPAAGFTGADTFTYTITDRPGSPDGLTDTGTVHVTVQPNEAPVAEDDAYTVAPTTEGRVLNVLLNDSDPEGDGLTITTVQSPTTAGGTVTCTATVCTYVPPSGPSSDTFTYTVSDGELTDTATVTITLVDCANPAPAFGGTGGLLVGHRWIECPGVEANGVVTTSPTTIMGVDSDGGLVMTSGSVANTAGPNDDTGTTASWGTSVRGARDVSILRLDLQVPSGAQCLAFDFTFGSEEYPEFVGSFNDAFLAELDTSSWVMSGNTITAPHNFALDSEGGVVSVNGTFFDPGRVIVGGGWEYDGSTARLTARTPITPGAHSIFLSVFDANDSLLDSGALIDNLRTGTTTCTGGVNQPPLAVDDTVSTLEDTPVDVAVLANDTDADPADTLSAIVIDQPANGAAGLNADGTIKFTPDANWFGTTSFTYRVTDSAGNSHTGVVTVTVTPVNDAPVTLAGPDRDTVEGSPVTLAGGVTDVDAASAPTLTWSIVSGPSVTTPPSGTFSSTSTTDPTFTPKENGTYVLQLAACDEAPLCDPTPDTMMVTVSNVAPDVHLPDDRTVDAGAPTSVNVTFTDPGLNDTHTAVIDWDDGTADTTVDPAVSPVSRTHTFTIGGTFTVEGCVTDDDSGADCDSMVVTVDGNGPPVAADDSATTAEDTAANIDVLANDSDPDDDPLTVAVATQPANGTAAANPNGSITFTPAANFHGPASFTYTVSDGEGGSDTATVTVTVTPVNDVPVADAGSDRTTPEGTGVTLLGSGSDVDSTPLTYSWTPAAGLVPNGTVAQPTFTPGDDGTTTFTLGVCDDAAPPACDATPDTMTVTASNVAPDVSAPADQEGDLDVPFSGAVDFTDPGTADTHTATVDWGDEAQPEDLGTVTSGFEVEHTYAAAGAYDVTVCVTDDDGGEGCATFTVTIFDGGAPVAVDDEDATAEDTPVPIFVLSNDADPDDDALEIVEVTDPDHGAVVVDEDRVIYTPPSNYVGTATFTYTISDGHGGTDTATVTVTVTPENDEPVVVSGPDRETVEGSPVAVSGSASDVDGPAPLSYHWSILSGPDVVDEPSGAFADEADPTTQFTPKQDGTYVLQLEVCDADELCNLDTDDDTVTVTVANVTPTVTLPANRTVNVGVSTSVTTTFTDPGADDTHTAVIDWGDGSADTTVDPAASPFARSHTFTTAGTRTVEACVSDDDGQGCDTMTITVIAPTSLRIADATITEPDSGTTPLTFTITASPVPTAPVTVVAKTVNGTATAPSDFTALPAAGQTVTFAAGQASRTVTVPIVGDLMREANETFSVILSAPTGASLGDSTAIGRINNDDVCTIVGTAAANILNGTAGNDVICGLGGNDTINGLGGNDTVFGGDGNDAVRGGTGNDTLRGEASDDVLNGEAGNDTIDGGSGTDEATWAAAPGPVVVDLTTNKATGWGTDTLAGLERARGGAFNDTLRGNGLRNSLWGGNGADNLAGRSNNDILDGQDGSDTLRGEAGSDHLIGGAGNDLLFGGDGADLLQGQASKDELAGEAGTDDLQGGAGNDIANGGDGNDDVQGNAGNDRVAGNNGNDRVDGGDGVDLVNGNGGNDNALGGPGNDNSPTGATAGVHGGTGVNSVNGGTGTDYCSFGPASETRISCERP